ncbi:bifunctional 4-hydroxy-2-oxoglutarate aldolase/2-dehydro-3-deoxy-phosphogluconate aldolase [Alterisphingorhabdus coralli]|uniref:2-dehydro-3-deoxy-phosphogluconate aldolase n=1 Tax=Alterisphingorhabdus coralli TaxID=3071408 RepID=A0AA97F7T4_9SPHN|nr:bifunctional 4-hydroxy-2-oxoglutarate aldolase/2-dehydro-3-deoxy-phosphogluconate aldolase [Parasphingorhabdus sp. SCSIO 66989]WOE75511.1 bifunctional 4-hydroxy-2-oxoglutarate aldolase/2-dehydro-3-deoxy-phosphogluconate aldolase [Parasphingorhabdus sp. SCSIO 66989]
MRDIETIMRTAPVIPVLVVHDVATAIPMAEALVAGGLPVLEVTLRTDCALEVIREMRQVDGAIVGAGTVSSTADLDKALDAGSEFIVSPGLTDTLGQAAIANDVPFLPGIANAGDIMRGMELGLAHFKFFPAMANGGVPALKALTGPFGNARFCPTGGIKPDNAQDWLALDQVLCVGGSWIVPGGAFDASVVQANAEAAAKIG